MDNPAPSVKIAMLGDIMGEPGLKVIEERLPQLIIEHSPDFIMVNGENSAGGFGLNEECLKRILALDIDVISGGNHTWEKRDFWPFLDSEKKLLRPANYPDGPGRGWIMIQKEIRGKTFSFLAINLQGRELLNNIDCPFRCFDSILLKECPNSENEPVDCPIILVDFHAESTREKEAFGFYADGRAAIVAGTHTHVQTADEKILPRGTAYISDLGMTGIANAVIGMDPKICIDRARNQVLYRMEAAVANNPAGENSAAGSSSSFGSFSSLIDQSCIHGIIAEIGDSGKAISIQRLKI